MDFIKCSENELKAMDLLLQAAEGFVNAMEKAVEVHEETSELLEAVLDDNEHYVGDMASDIKNNELFSAYKRFITGETNVTAYDAVNGTGAQVIEILHGHYDDVFGFYEAKGEKIFFLSKQHDNWNEESGESDNYFKVEETPVLFSECFRTNF